MSVAEPPVNNQVQVDRMTRWVERLRKTRVFRRLSIDAGVNPRTLQAYMQCTLTDGLNTIQTVKFGFHLPTTEFKDVYERLEEELVAVFRAHVRKMTAPEFVLEGASPVSITEAATDGDDWTYKF